MARLLMSGPGVRHAVSPLSFLSLLTLAFFAPVAAGAGGCVSNEYVIPHEDLVRLSSLAPDSRSVRVHVVQSIGERGAPAIEPPARFGAPPPSPPFAVDREAQDEPVASRSEPQEGAGSESDTEDDTDVEAGIEPEVRLELDGEVAGGGPDVQPARVDLRSPRPRPRTGAWVGPARTRATTSGPVTRGRPAAAAAGKTNGGSRASGSVRWAGRSATGSGGRGSGGGSVGRLDLGGGGGGGGNGAGEALVVLAVVAVAIAAVAMIGLIASEGARFDGQVEMSPDQPVHLEYGSGAKLVVPLGSITEAEAASAATARVMDDEGPGLRLLDQHLDRRGFTFKLDFGTLAFQPDTSNQTFSGLTSHVQIGYFITPRIGLLATAGLGGADDGLSATLTRHELGLELQAFPVTLGPFHLGAYANGGMAVLGTTAAEGTTATGTAAGGGLLVELDVTGRMALTVRAGADVARFAGGWSPAGTVAGGVAIY